MPLQRPGTRDQTYLDELISIPKGRGVGAARLAPLSEGGQRWGYPRELGGGKGPPQGGGVPGTCAEDLSVPRSGSGKSQPRVELFHA